MKWPVCSYIVCHPQPQQVRLTKYVIVCKLLLRYLYLHTDILSNYSFSNLCLGKEAGDSVVLSAAI